MTTIKIKRIYANQSKSDGIRVLVDRLWPRGMKKEDLQYDLWEKEIAPSPELRKWYHDDMVGRWSEFTKKYQKELENSEAVKAFLEKIQSHHAVTLLYAARDETRNHAMILQNFLKRNLK